MCGRFELRTNFDNLPKILKRNYPDGLEYKYKKQLLVRPTNPVLVLKNEGEIETTFMHWGFIAPWSKKTFNKSNARPFNARSETVAEKIIFKSSWENKRCLIPSTGFFEKGFLIRKKNHEPFWLGGIWSRWNSPDGTEVDSCCILTTESNHLVKTFNHRMPVIVPERIQERWIKQVENSAELNLLIPILKTWPDENWIAEDINKKKSTQISLF